MSNAFHGRDARHSTTPSAGRSGRWTRNAAVVAAVTISLGSLGMTSAAAQASGAQVAAATTTALSVPAAPAAVSSSRLDAFDAALLKMINAKRAAAGAVALREVVGLDTTSAVWSTQLIGLGRYGAVPANPDVAAQTLSAAPARAVFAQSVAKWYPQSVKAVDVFALYTSYPKALADMTNRSYKFVGIRTAIAGDGTSVATVTYTDSAVAAQIVDPSTADNPTGAITSAVQAGASVQLRGKAADPDAATTLQVKITDTVGAKVVTTVATSVAAGAFAATVPLNGYGTHTICATVLNQGAGANLSLGCTTARVGSLIGNADSLRQSGNQLTSNGWGYDPAAPTTALRATIVVKGPSGSRTLTVLSNVARADVARVFPAAGAAHGYQVVIPTLGKGVNTLCVTLLPASAGGVAKALACRSITVT